MDTESLEAKPVKAVERSERGEAYPLDLLIVLARRKKFILGVTLSAALLAAMVSLLMPNRYTATTKILPPQQSQSLAAALMGQLGSVASTVGLAQSSLGLRDPNDIYIGMLKSRTVEDALIRRFDLMKIYRKQKVSDARKDLEGSSFISQGKEGLITVSVEDESPTRAAGIANGYVEELRKVTQDLALTEAAQRRLLFERQVDEAKNDLANAEWALKQTQQRTGMIQLDGQTKAIIETVVRQRAEIGAKEVQLRVMKSMATERNPDVIRVEQELAGMRAQLATLERQRGDSDGNVQVATGKVPEAGLEYTRKLRDVKYYEMIFELLSRQYEAAKLDERVAPDRIQTMDPAVEPDRKSSPKHSLIIVIFSMLGFMGACIYVLGSVLTEGNPKLSRSLAEFKSALFCR